jgi:hypothetical protein
MALTRCILGTFLGVLCHCYPLPLDVPTFVTRCLHVPNNASASSNEWWNRGRECCPVVLPKWRLFYANIRHGTNCFTSPPKEGMLRIFIARKIRRLRPGLNPRTGVPEVSMLITRPLDQF